MSTLAEATPTTTTTRPGWLRIAVAAARPQTLPASLAPVVAGLVRHRRRGGELLLTAPGGADLDELIARLQRAGGKLVSVTPHHETLEDLFMRQVEGQDAGAGGAGGAATGVGADHRGGGAA